MLRREGGAGPGDGDSRRYMKAMQAGEVRPEGPEGRR